MITRSQFTLSLFGTERGAAGLRCGIRISMKMKLFVLGCLVLAGQVVSFQSFAQCPAGLKMLDFREDYGEPFASNVRDAHLNYEGNYADYAITTGGELFSRVRKSGGGWYYVSRGFGYSLIERISVNRGTVYVRNGILHQRIAGTETRFALPPSGLTFMRIGSRDPDYPEAIMSDNKFYQYDRDTKSWKLNRIDVNVSSGRVDQYGVDDFAFGPNWSQTYFREHNGTRVITHLGDNQYAFVTKTDGISQITGVTDVASCAKYPNFTPCFGFVAGSNSIKVWQTSSQDQAWGSVGTIHTPPSNVKVTDVFDIEYNEGRGWEGSYGTSNNEWHHFYCGVN